MCTVSFLPSKDRFFITSNRDEQPSRSVAFEPVEEVTHNCRLIYPKDPKAGGTWFAVNENGNVCVLLNGAFEKHISQGNYAMSRGLVLLKVISAATPVFELRTIDLQRIEPFTIILFVNRELLEFRWDGHRKYFKELDSAQAYIWSSATLYDAVVRRQRETLFDGFLKRTTVVRPEDIIGFHSNNHDDFENGFVINRNDSLKTLSITQAIVDEDEIGLNHMDLLREKEYFISMATRHMSNHSK
ncbi:NRDE family protein [Flavobacteriaceae bacterium 3-367]|uniref:NRDE family protein n=1 Tax=Eudoraea algarum TaxID=3417568 RepID=UPI00326BE101